MLEHQDEEVFNSMMSVGVEDGYIVPVSSTAQSISTEAKIIENK